MTVEAKFTTAGMTKGKRYDVLQDLPDYESVVIALDDGTIAVRRNCAFNFINGYEPMVNNKVDTKMKKCEFCEASNSNGTCKWEIANMPGTKEAGCNKAIERMMKTLQSNQSSNKQNPRIKFLRSNP